MLYKFVVSTLLNLLLHFLKQQEYIWGWTQLFSDIIMNMWPEVIRYLEEASFYFFNVLIRYSVHSSWKRNVPWNAERWDFFSWLTVQEHQRHTPQILLQAWALCYFTLSNLVSWGWHWNSMLIDAGQWWRESWLTDLTLNSQYCCHSGADSPGQSNTAIGASR